LVAEEELARADGSAFIYDLSDDARVEAESDWLITAFARNENIVGVGWDAAALAGEQHTAPEVLMQSHLCDKHAEIALEGLVRCSTCKLVELADGV